MSATLTAKPITTDAIGRADGTHLHAVVLFANFGFYHIARLNALRAVCPATGIEFAGEQRLYGWRTEKDNLAIRTLYPGVFEDITPGGVFKSCIALWKTLQDLKPSHLFIPGYTNVRCFTAAFWAITHRAESILMYESTEQDKPRSQMKERAKATIIHLLFSQAFVGGGALLRICRNSGSERTK